MTVEIHSLSGHFVKVVADGSAMARAYAYETAGPGSALRWEMQLAPGAQWLPTTEDLALETLTMVAAALALRGAL